MKNREIINELIFLVAGLGCTFLLISGVLKEYQWLLWIFVFVILIYRIIKNKDFFNWFDL